MKTKILSKLIIATLALVATMACQNERTNFPSPDDGTPRPYVIASEGTFSNTTTNALLSAASLDGGSIGMERGLVNDGASYWVFWGDKYLYALTYNQGNAGTTRSYVMNSDYTLSARSAEYAVRRFTTVGTYENFVIISRTLEGEFLNYKNVTYLPLTTNVCNALGIGFNFTDNTALLTYSGVCNKSSIDLGISSNNPATCKVEKAYAYIGSTYIPAYSEYPFLKYRDIIYMPLTWNNTYAFNLSTYWYTNNGFYLNINK